MTNDPPPATSNLMVIRGMTAHADPSPTKSSERPRAESAAALTLSHRRLLLRVARNELAARYAGSVLGQGWIWLGPLLILAIYGAVYLGIFRARIEGLTEVEYLLLLYTGLVPFLMTAEALANGAASMIRNKALLNNTVFPIDLAPVKAVLEAQPVMALGMTLVIIATAVVGRIDWTVVLLPVIWGLHVIWLVGCAWLLSVVNALFRDVQHLLTAAIIMLLIASPIAYTESMVPDALKPLIALNPFAYFALAYQRILIFGQSPSPLLWAGMLAASLGTVVLGNWAFTRARSLAVDYV